MNSSSSSNDEAGKNSVVEGGPLSYPSSSSQSSDKQKPSEKVYSEVRLFVANLNGSVNEHDLLITFRNFGKLKKLDLIFHKNGLQKGQPKGYAFVEFINPDQALKAKLALDGKPLRGKEMHIGFAKLNVESDSHSSLHGGPQRKHNDKFLEAASQKSTSLSLNKNLNRNDSTNSRIAALEAKLEAMRNRNKTESSSSNHSTKKSKHLPDKPDHLPPKPTSGNR